MKISDVYLILFMFIIGQLMISCTIFEPTTVTCPEFKSQKKEPAFKFKYLKQFPNRKRFFERTIPEFAINEQQKVEEVQLIQVKNKELESDPVLYNLTSEFAIFLKKNQLQSIYTKESTGSDRKIKNKNSFKIQNKNVPDSCDTILFIYGKEIQAKILEIGKDSIKYLNCRGMEGYIMEVHKDLVKKIKFSDGREELIFNDPLIQIETEKKQREKSNLLGFIISGLTILDIINNIVEILQLFLFLLIILIVFVVVIILLFSTPK